MTLARLFVSVRPPGLAETGDTRNQANCWRALDGLAFTHGEWRDGAGRVEAHHPTGWIGPGEIARGLAVAESGLGPGGVEAHIDAGRVLFGLIRFGVCRARESEKKSGRSDKPKCFHMFSPETRLRESDRGENLPRSLPQSPLIYFVTLNTSFSQRVISENEPWPVCLADLREPRA